MGHSIFSDKKRDIALMQFNDYYALRKDDKVAILRPNKEAITFIYKDRKLIQIDSDKKLEKELLAFIIVLDHLYSKKLYKWDLIWNIYYTLIGHKEDWFFYCTIFNNIMVLFVTLEY